MLKIELFSIYPLLDNLLNNCNLINIIAVKNDKLIKVVNNIFATF